MSDQKGTENGGESRTEYDPRVDSQRCIGCGLCPDMLGEVFALNHEKFGIAYVHDPEGWKLNGTGLLEETAYNCPVDAIVIDPEAPLPSESSETPDIDFGDMDAEHGSAAEDAGAASKNSD
jgi:ferredoxin